MQVMAGEFEMEALAAGGLRVLPFLGGVNTGQKNVERPAAKFDAPPIGIVLPGVISREDAFEGHAQIGIGNGEKAWQRQ